VKASQLHQMNIEELESELENLKRSLFQIRVRSQTEKVENTAETRNMRKDIARIITILKIKKGLRRV